MIGADCLSRVPVTWQADGATPLYIASQSGHAEVVKALVMAGAAVNQAWVRVLANRARLGGTLADIPLHAASLTSLDA